MNKLKMVDTHKNMDTVEKNNKTPNNLINYPRNTNKSIITKEILPYQKQCIDMSLDHYKNNNRGYIEMMCGTGKTLTSYWIDKHMNNKSTIIFVPSLYLLSQFYSEWINQSRAENIAINYILIGSDTDENHAFISLKSQKIRQKISASKIKNVIICTYQSHAKIKNIEFDFGIYDESHRTIDSVKYFTDTLHDTHVKIKKRLFMTATPKIFTRPTIDKMISMNNIELYGKKIFKYNLKTAIENKIS